jgi:hypothetical protein
MKIKTGKFMVSYYDLFIWLAILSPLIDSFNGFLNTYTTATISFAALIRFFTIILGFIIIVKNSTKTCSYIIFILSVLLFCSLFHVFYFDASIFESIYQIFQWVYFFIVYFGLRSCFSISEKYREKIPTYINFIGISSAFCLIIPYLMGYGNSTYSDSGYKGFFLANNGVSFLYITVFILEIFLLYKENKLYLYLTILLTAICLFLIGTKSCFISLCIGAIIISYKIVTRKSQQLFTFLYILVVFVVFLCLFKSQLYLAMLQRFNYFYKHSENFLDYLFLGRVSKIDNYIFYFNKNDNSFIKYIWGCGVSQFAKFNVIEMDYIDLFFQYGIIGFIVHLLLQFIIYIPLIKKNKSFIFYILVIVIYAFFVGHLFTNMLSSTLAAILLNYVFYYVTNKD